MPQLSDLMSSARNYPTGQSPAAPVLPRTLMEPPPEEPPQPAVDPSAFGQTLAAFLAQAGLADTLDLSGIAKGRTAGQFTLPWGQETLHLLSTGPKDPQPEQLILVPPEAYEQFGKTRSTAKRQALLDSIVAGTQGAAPTVLGGTY